MFPDDWTSEDERQLEDADPIHAWELRTPGSIGPGWVKYWPEWTDPTWVTGKEYSFNGAWQRPAPSGSKRALRPAILNVDRIWKPTRYALYVPYHIHLSTNLVETESDRRVAGSA